jgi:hypothetical protein
VLSSLSIRFAISRHSNFGMCKSDTIKAISLLNSSVGKLKIYFIYWISSFENNL